MKRCSRREFLTISAAAPCALGLLGLGSNSAAEGNAHTPLIILFLVGGVSAKEFTNPDPASAPVELRGPLASVATRTAGVHFSEVWPQLAARQDRFSVLRAIDAGTSDHFPGGQLAFESGGSTIQERIGERASNGGVPYSLLHVGSAWINSYTQAFRPSNALVPLFENNRFIPPRMAATPNISERRKLLEAFDTQVPSPQSARYDRFRGTAFDLLQGGGQFFRALELPDADRRRYGRNQSGDLVLTAKRLIEAGAGAVVIFHDLGGMTWDMHGRIAQYMRADAPKLDNAAAMLIDEIASERLNASLLMMGEINRTPRINLQAGRDHWRLGNQAILAGPRIRRGVVHGRTNAQGQILDGAVQQREQLGNTVLMACGLEVNPAAPKVREILR